MTAPPLRSLDDVTAGWFSAALAKHYPGTTVTRAEPRDLIRGMATKAQYALEYNDAGRRHGLPETLWLKAGLEAHSERSAPLYAAEVNFYRDLAPRLRINLPRSYYQGLDGETGSGVLLLEDLKVREVRFGRATDTVDVETARKVLALCAQIHAVLEVLGDETQGMPWLHGGAGIDSADVVDEFFGFWDDSARRPRFAFVTGPLTDRDRVRRAIKRMRALDRTSPRKWFVHGDCHLGNMFFEMDGSVGLLDWQTTMLGDWASDVAEFLLFSLDVELRRAHERALIAYYLDRLSAAGGAAPSFDEAWLSYRRHAAWGFMATLCPVEMQSEETCSIWSQRSCAAMLDLGALEALESA